MSGDLAGQAPGRGPGPAGQLPAQASRSPPFPFDRYSETPCRVIAILARVSWRSGISIPQLIMMSLLIVTIVVNNTYNDDILQIGFGFCKGDDNFGGGRRKALDDYTKVCLIISVLCLN